MCLYLLKMSMLEELSDSQRLIDFGICLIIEIAKSSGFKITIYTNLK